MTTEQTTTKNTKRQADKRPVEPIRKKDLLFKILAKLRVIYLALVNECLPDGWLKLLAVEKAELLDTVTVDGTLRERLGDLVLKNVLSNYCICPNRVENLLQNAHLSS